MRELTDSIVITLSQQTIKERRGGLRQILNEWRDSDGEKTTWWYKCGAAPKVEIVNVYWVIGGRVRWKSKLLQVERDKWMMFSPGTPMYGKCWLILFDFEPIPRRDQVYMKGFQGFRYFYL